MSENIYYDLGHDGSSIKAFLDEQLSNKYKGTYRYCGIKASYSDLQSEEANAKTGDVWYVSNDDTTYVWIQTSWQVMSMGAVLSELVQKDEIVQVLSDATDAEYAICSGGTSTENI